MVKGVVGESVQFGVACLGEPARLCCRSREGDGVPAVPGAPFGGEAFGYGLSVYRVGGCRAGGFIEVVLGYGGDLLFGYDFEGDGLGGVGYGVAVGAQLDRVGTRYGGGSEDADGVGVFVVFRGDSSGQARVEFHAVATFPAEGDGVDGHVYADGLVAGSRGYFRQAGVFDFSVSDVVSQVGRLVIGHVLPGDAHAVDVVVHEGGYSVLGGGCGGKEYQTGGIAPVPQYDFFSPIAK